MTEKSSLQTEVQPTIRCCVCGSVDAVLWRTSGDNLLGGTETYRALRCVRCGTGRLDPRPSGSLSRFYTPDTYARAEEAESEIGKRLDTYNSRIAARADAATTSQSNNRKSRVLDVGCGDGRFLSAMADLGWDIVGTETDSVAAELAHRRTGAIIYEQTLENLPTQESAFDLITLLHVLEHLPDPRQTLTDCFCLLRPGGTLLIAVPNGASAESAIFGNSWYHLDLPRHLWSFTPHTLVRLVEESGFENPTLGYYPFLFAPQSVRNLMKRLRKTIPTDATIPQSENPSRQGSGGRLQTQIFLTLLNLSERLGNHLPGEIMELIVHRPAN